MPAGRRFHILLHVILNSRQVVFNNFSDNGRIPEFSVLRCTLCAWLLLFIIFVPLGQLSAGDRVTQQREEFIRAWSAASRGERAVFDQSMPGLRDYLLFPYLQYEDLRHRRRQVPAREMSAFLDGHEDWAFHAGLKKAWLRTLGTQGQWDSLILYAPGFADTEVECHLAHARIRRGQTEGLLPVAQSLWTVGKSQPDACDPVFSWLKKHRGITSGLAWERIRLAMEARQPRLILYLARYVSESERAWVDRWYRQDRTGYHRLDRASQWPDVEKSREITQFGLKRLSRSDPDRAWELFQALDRHFNWPPAMRGGILREMALWSAVDGAVATPDRMQAVPDDYRDDQLLEWSARHDLSRGSWEDVIKTISAMSPELRDDAQWRYWDARARLESGDMDEARSRLTELALEANYYGFLSADSMDLPYTICAQEPQVDAATVEALAHQPGFDRALQLRKAGISNWARSEWTMAAHKLDTQELRVAAALANREGWPDMAIFALGNSGDLRWYKWRFPIEYEPLVQSNANSMNLDPSWIMGLMRSESAMAEDAVSSAGARGLMQVTPQTAKQLAKLHSYSYTGRQQLMRAEDNIRFGTTYLRDLLNRFYNNPVLASGAYNAGPHAVDRWLADRQTSDPVIWIETLPYFETRDYIPRVMAFSTLYDWRLMQPVTRISSRMPAFDSAPISGTMKLTETAEVVCRTPG